MVKNSFIEKTYVVGTHRKMNTHAKIRCDKTNVYTFKSSLLPENKSGLQIRGSKGYFSIGFLEFSVEN